MPHSRQSIVSRRADPAGDRFFALRTFRRDGSVTSTPIWLAPSGGRWYAYTPNRSWKIKRIRQDDRVEIAASNFNGEPRGQWRTGRADILLGTKLRHAKRALIAKYGNQFRMFEVVTLLGALRKHGGRAVGLEITLDDNPTTSD
jgi:uncharacterized protein